MKLFQTVQNHLELLGYIRNHGGYRYYPFSIRHLRATLIFISGMISIFIFVIRSADSPEEYMDSFYGLTVTFSVFASHMNTTFEMAKLFDFFDKCEKVCDRGKFNFILNRHQ